MKDQVDAVTEVGLRATYLNSSLELEERRRRVAGARRRRVRAVLRGARGDRGVGRATRSRAGPAPHRRRRSPLHQPVGPRLPARVPQPGRAQAPLRRRAGAGADRDGDARGHRRHHRAAGDGASRSPSAAASSAPTCTSRSTARAASAATARGEVPRVREAILRLVRARAGQSGIVYCLSRKSVEATADFLQRARRARRRLPRRHGVRGAQPRAGGVPPRRRRRRGRDGRVRHGHRQVQRPLRHPPRHAALDRGLLPGDRPRRAATACPATACSSTRGPT